MAQWDWLHGAALAAVFVTVLLALEGAVLLWQHTRSPSVRRLQRRLSAWLPRLEEAPSLAQARDPGAFGLQPLIDQAAWQWSARALLGLCAVLGALTLLISLTAWSLLAARGASGSAAWLWSAVLALAAASAPLLALFHQRQRRLKQLTTQLPDALELMARAMRSGHAFSTALQLVAGEGPQPLGLEFRRISEQIGFGRDPDSAFDEFARRVPQDEVRFFVMAVRLQRQTGGQLAEILSNIARLVRQRLRLRDKVRVLTAEGRLSARVLMVMPLATAGVIQLVRPSFLQVLWTDPAGISLLQASITLMLVGWLWLWRLTQVRI